MNIVQRILLLLSCYLGIHRLEEQFSPVLDQNIADNPLYTEQVNKISVETPTTVIPTQKWTLVMVNRTHSSFSSQTAITEPYWNQTSFYMNLGQFYEQQPLYLHLSNHLNSFSSRSQCLQCGSHYPLLIIHSSRWTWMELSFLLF